ncbi:MAG: ATPase [Clostridia bacterium]|nr:ATPase [Clostridia bacterium]
MSAQTNEIYGSIHSSFKKELWSSFIKAVKQYELIKDGDRIAVCMSGGKDSMLMAALFREYEKYGSEDFTVRYICMDPGYSPRNREMIEKNARLLDIPLDIFESRIFDSVFRIEKSPCYLCARMRRGHLYSYAKEQGCNKIALGHHYDDVIETILMGMLWGGQMQSMIPKLHSTNFEGMELIRPMYLIREKNIIRWKEHNGLTFLQCACRFTEQAAKENNEDLSKRKEIKELIQSLKKTNPYIEQNIFKSSENVNLDTLLSYKTKGERHSFLEDYDKQD